ncbi:MAG: tRNA (adenosine(37)-N6)-threonylcarbamoyltransferase complex dimerization subunit type 1 TsaB [Pseudomonadales bacterium]
MARLLALDTSAEACSVALLDGDNVLEEFALTPRGHTEHILPMVEKVLAASAYALSSMDAIAFGRGPGSFTGLRIAAGVVQGLAFGADLSVVPVSSLAAIAQGFWRTHPENDSLACVAVDARMNEVYFGCYQRAGAVVRLVAEERICAPEAVTLPSYDGTYMGLGSGWEYFPQMDALITQSIVEPYLSCPIHAQDIATLAAVAWAQGEAVDPVLAQPVYLRNEVSWKKVNQ